MAIRRPHRSEVQGRGPTNGLTRPLPKEFRRSLRSASPTWRARPSDTQVRCSSDAHANSMVHLVDGFLTAVTIQDDALVVLMTSPPRMQRHQLEERRPARPPAGRPQAVGSLTDVFRASRTSTGSPRCAPPRHGRDSPESRALEHHSTHALPSSRSPSLTSTVTADKRRQDDHAARQDQCRPRHALIHDDTSWLRTIFHRTCRQASA